MATKEYENNKFREAVLGEMSKAEGDTNNNIRKYLTKIITACMSYGGSDFTFSKNKAIEKKVNSLLSELSGDIYISMYNRIKKAADEAFKQENYSIKNSFILDFMAITINKRTIAERIEYYLDNLKYEFEAYVAIGLANGYNVSQIVDTWLRNKKKPLDYILIKNNIDKFSARDLQKDVSFGQGYNASSFVGLKDLEMNSTFQSYNYVLNRIWQDKGIVGWYTIRGSNYPCPYCDAEVGKIHKTSEFFYGYHPRCRCIMIPVDENGKKVE